MSVGSLTSNLQRSGLSLLGDTDLTKCPPSQQPGKFTWIALTAASTLFPNELHSRKASLFPLITLETDLPFFPSCSWHGGRVERSEEQRGDRIGCDPCSATGEQPSTPQILLILTEQQQHRGLPRGVDVRVRHEIYKVPVPSW